MDHLFENREEAWKRLQELKGEVERFNDRFKGRLKELTPSQFLEALEEYERLMEEIDRVEVYIFLQFALDSSKGKLLAQFEEEGNRVRSPLLWFELEFIDLPEELQQKFIEGTPRYRYLLLHWLEEKPYRLGEGEERILLLKSSTSREAFVRLFDEEMAKLKVEWEGKEVGEEELLAKLYSPDREERRKAQNLFTEELRKRLPLLSYIYNQVKRDWNLTYREIRGYPSPEEVRHLANRVSRKSVDSLIEAVNESMGLVERYYRLKQKLLGLEELTDYDRYAPLQLAPTPSQIPVEEAKERVVESFKKFDPLFGKIVQKGFEEGWVDFYPKPGKRSGAFSCATTTDCHPYVLLNYTGTQRDLFTIAHEMGHAIHQYLSREVGYLQQDTPLTTAETASIFGEMLLFEKLKGELELAPKLQLIAGKLEEVFATIHRQIVFTNFERRVFEERGELEPDQFNSIWFDENRKMFGDSLKLTDNYRLWWSYIPHFYHSPFYCYAYAYAALLVFSLFQLYREGFPNFKPLYIQFLKEGGAVPPVEQFKRFGLNLEEPTFWRKGLTLVEELLSQFEEGVGKFGRIN